MKSFFIFELCLYVHLYMGQVSVVPTGAKRGRLVSGNETSALVTSSVWWLMSIILML